MEVVKSIGLFVLVGLCEIGGGYLVWQWLREGKSIWVGLIGAVAGVFTLPMVVLAHEISEFIVIGSGLRMLRS